VEEVTTPCTQLPAARTRNLVHYELNFPAFLKLEETDETDSMPSDKVETISFQSSPSPR